MSPGEEFCRFDLRGVPGDPTVMVPVHLHDLGQT